MIDRNARRQELLSLLGDLPDRGRPIGAHVVATEERGTYVLEKLLLDLNGVEPVPAYFTRPLGAKGPVPIVVYHHAHGGNYVLGKDELLVGRDALQRPAYAEAMAGAGYASICIDAWLFGERRGRTESELFKQMLWEGRVLWGMMLFDALRTVDYVAGRPDVDASRIATTGISLGSTTAWWLAALDERVKVCVDLCCLTDFQALIETRGLDGHGIYYYVPRLLKHFTASEINALIAPRPHLGLAGRYDRLTPPAGLDRIDAALKAEYEELGAPKAWRLHQYDTGHFETAAMRAEVMAFLAEWL